MPSTNKATRRMNKQWPHTKRTRTTIFVRQIRFVSIRKRKISPPELRHPRRKSEMRLCAIVRTSRSGWMRWLPLSHRFVSRVFFLHSMLRSNIYIIFFLPFFIINHSIERERCDLLPFFFSPLSSHSVWVGLAIFAFIHWFDVDFIQYRIVTALQRCRRKAKLEIFPTNRFRLCWVPLRASSSRLDDFVVKMAPMWILTFNFHPTNGSDFLWFSHCHPHAGCNRNTMRSINFSLFQQYVDASTSWFR